MSKQEAMDLAKLLVAQYSGQESFQLSLGDTASFTLVHAAFTEVGCAVLAEPELLMLTVSPPPLSL